MTYIIDGQREATKLNIKNYIDHPTLALNDGDKRKRKGNKINKIILHTTKGIWPQDIKPGLGPNNHAGDAITSYWSRSKDHAGAHLIIDSSGEVTQHCDLFKDAAYHAGIANETSIGIEIFQYADGHIYDGQIDVCLALVEELCKEFAIIRRVCNYKGLVAKSKSSEQLKNYWSNQCGIFGHRNITTERGRGDPGDHIINKMLNNGFNALSFYNTIEV